jgi:hypothetical protein
MDRLNSGASAWAKFEKNGMRATLTRGLALIGLIAIGALAKLSAQAPVGLHISSLTTVERDSLMRAVPKAGALKVVFACVPAGVLVFASDGPGTSREALRAQAVQALAPWVAEDRITEGTITLHAAEQACETARDQ